MNYFFIAALLLFTTASAAPTLLNRDPNADATRPSLALDAQGRAVIAWVETQNGVKRTFVRRWGGSGWGDMGNFLNVNPRFPAAYTSLALNALGNPVVAFTEKNTEQRGKVFGSGKLYVKQFDGRGWTQIGPSPSKSENTVSDTATLRLDTKGYPVVAWHEIPPDFNADLFYMSRWNGSRWVTVDWGTLNVDISSGSRSRTFILRGDEPILVYSKQLYISGAGGYFNFQIYVGQWAGSYWRPMGITGRSERGEGSLNQSRDNWAGAGNLALDSLRNPVVAYNETSTGFNIYVQRWNGTSWLGYSSAVNEDSGLGYRPQIKMDAQDNPVVAWLENSGALQMRVARWDGAGWAAYPVLNQNLKADVESFSLALDKDGNPVVAWAEMVGKNHQIFVARWNGTAWVELGK
jgi:hypothetical protein